jgi:ribosomal protein L9
MKDWLIKYWLDVIFGAALAGVGVAYRHLLSKLKKKQEEQRQAEEKMGALTIAVKALLHGHVTQIYTTAQKDGFCSVSARDSAEELNEAYKILNDGRECGTIEGLMRQIHKMRTEAKE